MKLIPIIQKINRIKKDISENQTLISTILPVFKYLNWDIFNENRVIFEDVTSTKKRVDLTFVFADDSKFIIEAKRLSHKLSIKDFEQLTVYLNSDDSVDFGILTNGIDYWIADNKGRGLDGKKIYGFNIFDITECDINILKLFFSFIPSYKLEDLNRYINYIKTGVDFGDKTCMKVLELKNFEVDKQIEPKISIERTIKPKTVKEIQIETNIAKPKFDKLDVLEKEENLFSEVVIEKEVKKNEPEVQEEPVIETKKFSTIESDKKNDIDYSEVEVVKADSNNVEFFDLIEKNKAKIYIGGEYHIIKDDNFSLLFVKMIKYTFSKIESYPKLFNKVINEFSFIVKKVERNSQSAKYELISEGYYFNININNYAKLQHIEAILKFIDKNYE